MFSPKDRCKRPQTRKGNNKRPPNSMIFFSKPNFFGFFEIYRSKMTFYGIGNQFSGFCNLQKLLWDKKPKKRLFLIKRPTPKLARNPKKDPPPYLDPLKKTPPNSTTICPQKIQFYYLDSVEFLFFGWCSWRRQGLSFLPRGKRGSVFGFWKEQVGGIIFRKDILSSHNASKVGLSVWV